MKKCITRVWHGLIKATDKDTYGQYVIDTGIADYKSIPGNLGVKMMFRLEGELCHIYTVSEWDSYESIKAFAGQDYELARYYPEDSKFLLEKEKLVQHYETIRF